MCSPFFSPGDRPYTVFAPNNEAFSALADAGKLDFDHPLKGQYKLQLLEIPHVNRVTRRIAILYGINRL